MSESGEDILAPEQELRRQLTVASRCSRCRWRGWRVTAIRRRRCSTNRAAAHAVATEDYAEVLLQGPAGPVPSRSMMDRLVRLLG